MARYQHVMYLSRPAIAQVYSELSGKVDHGEVEQESRVTDSVKGKVGSFFSIIAGAFSGDPSKHEIRSVNFDDELSKAKKAASSLLSDEEIRSVSGVDGGCLELNRLYRFSCEVTTEPFESEIDGQTYIEVVGERNGIRFRGDTSRENWGSRSHIVQSVRAAERGEPYPYQGLMWPVNESVESETIAEYDVKFLLICGPKTELMDRWHDRATIAQR